MISTEFNFSTLIADVISRLEYISGKRDVKADEYFRLTATTADMDMLHQLAEEGLLHISLSLGALRGHHSLKGDIITITINRDVPASSEEVGRLIRHLLLNHIICSWLSLTHFGDLSDIEKDIKEDEEKLLSILRSFGPLQSRTLSPI